MKIDRMWKVYVHISPSNKRYYGITSKENPNDRWKNGKNYKNNIHFTRAIERYGWNNFTHDVLFENLTEEEAKLLEQCYIILYDTTNQNKGYNITLGGEGILGYRFTEEQIKMLSESKKGRIFTEEHRTKLSESKKGNKNPNYGKHLTEETKKKLSEVNKGRNNAGAKSVICLTTKRIFLTIIEGAEYYNTSGNGEICNCCKGFRMRKGKRVKVKSCGKLEDGTPLVWRYININHNKILRGKGISKLHSKSNQEVA